MYNVVYNTMCNVVYTTMYNIVYTTMYNIVYNTMYNIVYNTMHNVVYTTMYNIVYTTMYNIVYNVKCILPCIMLSAARWVSTTVWLVFHCPACSRCQASSACSPSYFALNAWKQQITMYHTYIHTGDISHTYLQEISHIPTYRRYLTDIY